MPSADWIRLLALASHELRTPANVAAGYVRMLRDGLPHPPTDAQLALLEAADRSLARVTELLTEMSDVARLASGRVSPTTLPVALDGVVTAVAAGLVRGAQSGIRIETRPPSTPVVVDADYQHLVGVVGAMVQAVARDATDDTVIVATLDRVADARAAPPSAVLVVGEAAAVETTAAREWTLCDGHRPGNGLGLVVAGLTTAALGGRLEWVEGACPPILRLTLPLAPDRRP